MYGTVKQFHDAIEEMRSIYPFENEDAKMTDFDIISRNRDCLQITIEDERTGIVVTLSKKIVNDTLAN